MNNFSFNFIALSIIAFLFSSCSSIPEKVKNSQTTVECTYLGGYSAYSNNIAYNNSCSKDSEYLFLTGYRISRKATLIQLEIEKELQVQKCLKLENDLKFSRTMSPIRIELTNDDVGKKLSDANCSNSFFSSSSGILEDIRKSTFKIENLQTKRSAIYELHQKISNANDKANDFIKSYKENTPQDDLDADFQWADYINKSGGYKNLSEEEQQLVLKEVYKIPELKSDVLNGALLGFGTGHKYQNQNGWIKYAIIDSLVAAGIIYGIHKNDTSISLPLLIFAVPISRGFQFYEVYQYNLDRNIDFQNLRTENNKNQLNQFQVSFNFSF